MSYEIPTTEPITIVAGATVKWTRQLDDYSPDDGWVLSYAFKLPGAAVVAVTCTDNGDGSFLATMSVVTTAALAAGTYTWQAWVTKDSEAHPVDQGRLVVEANLATTASSYDPRSATKKILDALEARVQGRITADQESLSIDGISIARIPMGEAISLYRQFQGLYEDEVNEERRRRGLPIAAAPRIRF